MSWGGPGSSPGIGWRKLEGHRDGVTCLEFSPDGARLLSKWIATGDRDGAVSLREAAAEGRVRRRLRGHASSVSGAAWHVAWSPDGTMIAATGGDGIVTVWRAE